MPPVRTQVNRAGKSERTHEENVERAFIAASRRCDRTLEARVESARRASEVHKARTGRGLKITEKDVQNEEMYEEEDDDLPLQYRHLTAGFQTSSPDFNRRFAAYLTTHVAIRTALEQSIIQSYQQQEQQQQQQLGINTPTKFQHLQYERFPSPLITHQAQQSQRIMSPVQGSPVSRYSPYPVPPRPNLASPLTQEQRPLPSPSIVTQLNTDSINSDLPPTEVSKLMSLPSTPIGSTNDGLSTPSPLSIPPFISSTSQHSFKLQQSEELQNHLNVQNSLDLTKFGPLSTALPAETQTFLEQNMGLENTSNEIYNVTNHDVKLSSFDTQIKPETKAGTCGLDMTLLPEISVQSSPYLFENSNYFDNTNQAETVNLTPGSVANDENSWRCFINRSDSWSFSE